ncbi:MAG: hypothetical protein NDF58_08545 [archaeon YNP-LCB-024-027]|jgi:hypothetical protein|nr:hypothetical protein [Candidatus Culexarchaeum yellowstonense]
MSENKTIIKIPPLEYPTARRLTFIFAVIAAAESYADYNIENDMVVINEPPQSLIPKTFKRIVNIHEVRKKVYGKDVLPSPPLRFNINDYKWVGKRLSLNLSFTIKDDESICDFFIKVMDAISDLTINEPEIFSEEMNAVTLAEDTLYLGTKNKALFPQLQIFKIEKYKHGKEYLGLATFRGDMKISPVWYGVLGGGWLATFAGYIGNILTNVIIDDYTSYSALIGKNAGKLTEALSEYSCLPLKVKEAPSHGEAYTLLSALQIDPNKLRYAVQYSIRYSKITLGNNTYTVTEEIPFDVSPIHMVIQKLLTEDTYKPLKNVMENLLRCTLRAYANPKMLTEYCKKNWGNASTMATMVRSLWNVLMGINPHANIYTLVRLSPSEEDSYNFRQQNIVRLLYRLVSEAFKVEAPL